MFCQKCGAQVEGDKKLCKKCEELALREKESPDHTVEQSSIENERIHSKKFNIIDYYVYTFKNGADFSGRASRKEYWMFFLSNLIIGLVLSYVEEVIGVGENYDESIFSNIYSLIVMIPSYAVAIRRMHDLNKSGWNILIPIYNIILSATAGNRGNNNYGPEPKQ